MKPLTIILCIFLGLGLGAVPAIGGLLDEADGAASRGQYQQAVKLYGQAVQDGGLSGRILAGALNQRGLALMHLGLLDQAIADFTQALKVDHTFAEAYRSRSLAYEYKGQMESAYVDAEWYAHYAPQDPQATERLKDLTRKMMRAPKKK